MCAGEAREPHAELLVELKVGKVIDQVHGHLRDAHRELLDIDAVELVDGDAPVLVEVGGELRLDALQVA
jgi:hypothetical protein